MCLTIYNFFTPQFRIFDLLIKNLRDKSLLTRYLSSVNEINVIMLLINDSMLHAHQVCRLAPRWDDDWDGEMHSCKTSPNNDSAVVLCLASFFISFSIASFVELHGFLWNIHSSILNLSLRIRHCMQLHSEIESRSFSNDTIVSTAQYSDIVHWRQITNGSCCKIV